MPLTVEGLTTGFGAVEVLRGVDLELSAGRTTVLFGLNGAGKSLTLRTISGIQPAWGGTIQLNDTELTGLTVEDRVRAGIGHVLQVGGTFPHLTVGDNLRLGGSQLRPRAEQSRRLDELFDLYPRLAERRRQRAGSLSGGERAMLAVARTLMARPRVLLVDEPTAGLSPGMAEQLLDTLGRARATGVDLLVAEQNVSFGLRLADEIVVLERGRVVYREATDSLDQHRVAQLLGIGQLVDILPTGETEPRHE
jgi:branched-chain amino acid transport system ATP-binding protein